LGDGVVVRVVGSGVADVTDLRVRGVVKQVVVRVGLSALAGVRCA
jgi:hypothetical protein